MIETDRLVLRRHGEDDFDALHALWSDPLVIAHVGGVPLGREQVWHRLLRYIGHWAVRGYGMWVVETRDGAFVGDVGIFEGRRGLGPRFDSAPEVGWVLSPAAWGRGYATEAVLGALGWIEATHGIDRTVCLIESGHRPSIHVAERAGFAHYDAAEYKGEAIVLMERRRPAAGG
ncbi:GNAT family N-acetyltransferase [Sphingomonas flavalba]|uniref:GNAT family N-acetyltransferase n=1 Tax=Sphingomonas flavalba TaxID=2559804 RepID=UPI0039E08436